MAKAASTVTIARSVDFEGDTEVRWRQRTSAANQRAGRVDDWLD